ncbi:MAG TPA: hypothetical protein VMH87_20695 [Pseudomonadales bacterium]|nr:hypothetical protein [Pseudomonadales bacterium]
MKNEVVEPGKQPRHAGNRVNPLDARIAELEARIEKNKAALERNNQKIASKITQLEKRVEIKK